MKKIILLGIMLFLVVGCATKYSTANRTPSDIYRYMQHKILDWQERVKKEKWSSNLVDEIMLECTKTAIYENDIIGTDYWKTYNEFVKTGFRGDCEDIASFMYGTLKRLNYPYRVRMIGIIIDSNKYHVALKVEVPNKRWNIYDSTSQFKIKDYISFGEWDEDKIYKPQTKKEGK